MRIADSYPDPIHGVSTLAPQSRPKGYATSQINFRSDPVNKLTRRPSSIYGGSLATVSSTDDMYYHSYTRYGKEFSFILDKLDGTLSCFVSDNLQATLSVAGYHGDLMEMFTIDDLTYVVNKRTVVESLETTEENTVEKVSHINVTSALNYGETVQVNVTTSDDTRHVVSYTVPDLGTTPDYDTADKARATKQVALELAARINGGGTHTIEIPNPAYDFTADMCVNEYTYTDSGDGINFTRVPTPSYDPTNTKCQPYSTTYPGITGVTAVALGSTVAVWEDGRAEWLQLEIETGQGSRSVVAINKVIEQISGLPLYAVVGTRITVRPDPTTEKGTYYLQAERISDYPTGEDLEEVVWSESRSPYEPYIISSWTMPRVVDWSESVPTISHMNIKTRESGDDESVPFPTFVGKTIETMGYFQNRLVIVADNTVHMSETDDTANWFRQSAVQLLVTDPVAISTSALGTDTLLYIVPHNRDLLCISRNAQFKISGDTPITPQTVSMSLTTRYECQPSASPVSMGNSVYFPVDYGDSTGLQEYTGERDTGQDFAASITNHIIGYLQGSADILVASPNLEMLAVTAYGTADNVIYVYNQYTESGGKRSQQAWSEWHLPENEKVLALEFRKNKLVIIFSIGTTVFTKYIPIYSRVTGSPLDVYLDNLLTETVTGDTFNVPTGYDMTDCVIVRGVGTESELWEVGYTVDGSTVTLDEDLASTQVYVGKPFRSSYTPTRPFRYDEDGSVITGDKVRVGSWRVSLVDTHRLSMNKTSKFNDPTTYDFQSRVVGEYPIGSKTAYTGDWKFPFSEEAGLAEAEFFVDGYLGCTITDIGWDGQYFQSTRRM